jgi:hypothetical protein
LKSKVAEKGGKDNLIINYSNINVSYSNGVYNVTYCFVANSPVNRIFNTGYSLDPSVILN